MLRLTIVSQSAEEVVLKVDGWLAGENVALLEREGMGHLQKAHCLVLDLKGVKFIDQTGIALLQQWSGTRLVLRHGSSFIKMLLKAHGLD